MTAGERRGPWPRNGAFGAGGLSVAGCSAKDLAERFGTPLVVVDEAHVRERCRRFRGAFPRALWAVKAFPAGALIRIAAEEGLGLLVATGGELDACLRAGAQADRIAFHGTNKSDAEIETAVGARVGLLIVDNEEELDRISAAAEAAGVEQAILLRVVPGLEAGTHEYVRTGTVDTKFGIPLDEGMAAAALARALRTPGVRVAGIHAHIGSQVVDAAPYLGALEVVLSFLEEIRREVGFVAQVLDVGGGMAVTYRDERPFEPEDLGRTLGGLLARECAARGLEVPELVVEPGRAITSGAAVTLYSVGTIKRVPGRIYVNVDGGMSDNIRPALYGSRYTIELASRASQDERADVTVVGRHCESGDVLARDVALQSDLRRGDLLAVASTGAYEYAMASTYNKVGRPAVVLVADGQARVILRRETEDDLARLEVPGE